VNIETTGRPNPGPVAQTFFMDEAIHDQYLLDAVVTVVDAKHAGKTLDDHDEARRQVGFADRILITKSDLVDDDGKVDELMQRLRRMNPRAQQSKVHMGEADIKELLDIRGFNLNAALELDPEFLKSDYHEHDDDVKSFVWKDARPLHMEKIETFLSLMVQNYGEDLLRYKGVLNVQGEPRRMIFQGVHMLMGGTPGKPWEAGETRESVMVFIGRKLPRRLFEEGLAYCVA
jgi:G3E family GTPase